MPAVLLSQTKACMGVWRIEPVCKISLVNNAHSRLPEGGGNIFEQPPKDVPGYDMAG